MDEERRINNTTEYDLLAHEMSDIDYCDFGLTLASSHLYKLVLTTKICISLAGILVLAMVCGRVKHTRSFMALHSNVRRTLACHVFYIIVTNTFILIGNSIDLIRLSIYHPNACDYLLPYSLTFFVRETYMFGIFGVAMTFAMLSLERCVATYQQKYEYNRSRLLFLCLVAVKALCAVAIAFFFMGYNVIFSSRVVTFTAVTKENANRLTAFIYSILGCELICVLSYHIIFLLNMRDRNQISVKRRRLEQITKKSLSEKYQIDETRRVLRMMLPVSWCHLFLYTMTYGGYWFYTKVASVPETLEDNVNFVSMVEIFGVIIFYPFVFSFFIWRHFVKPRTHRLTQITIEDTQDYFKQMNELFRSSPMK